VPPSEAPFSETSAGIKMPLSEVPFSLAPQDVFGQQRGAAQSKMPKHMH
jgi:hypothetical protein